MTAAMANASMGVGDDDVVLIYLQRMSEAVAVLASDSDSNSENSGVADPGSALRHHHHQKSCEYYVDRISQSATTTYVTSTVA